MRSRAVGDGVTILVVDESREAQAALAEAIREAGYGAVTSAPGEEALAACRRAIFPVIVADSRFGSDKSGLSALHAYKALQPDAEIIITTVHPGDCSRSENLQAGAFDCLAKPFPAQDLIVQIARALAHRELERETQALRRVLSDRSLVSSFVGRSPAILEARKRMVMAADSILPVLIRGETGTGKSLAARLIHVNSPRREQRLMTLDCRASPETLLGADLFGAIPGDPDDPHPSRAGAMVEANGGTVLLEEVAALSSTLQTALLRVLKTRRLRRPGSKHPIPLDVRLIATDRGNLASEVRRGRFRHELYERLSMIEVNLPPLRDRPGDIPELVGYFLNRQRQPQGTICHLSPQGQLMLLAYGWPGNVLELEDCLKTAAEASPSGILSPAAFPLEIRSSFSHELSRDDLFAGLPSLQELGKRYLSHVMELTKGNKSEAAAVLGISRKTLYRMKGRFNVWPRGPRKKRDT